MITELMLPTVQQMLDEQRHRASSDRLVRRFTGSIRERLGAQLVQLGTALTETGGSTRRPTVRRRHA